MHETKLEALRIWMILRYGTLDLGGFRSGSMNEVLPASELRIRS